MVVEVVVGIIPNASGKVLVAQRGTQQHLGGKWEFPGGKVEPGENFLAALSRELMEEVDVIVKQATPFLHLIYQYPEVKVSLRIFYVQKWRSATIDPERQEPFTGKEQQPLLWTAISQLQTFNFPQANQPIVQSLQMGQLIAISPPGLPIDDQLDPKPYLEAEVVRLKNWVNSGLASGVRCFHLRLPHLGQEDYLQIIETIKMHLTDAPVWLIANPGAQLEQSDDPLNPAALSFLNQLLEWADGLHWPARLLQILNSAEYSSSNLRALFRKTLYLSASCHSVAELKVAERLGLNSAFLSPVLATASHPDVEPLGWSHFNEVSQQTWLPCYALGGVSPEHLETALAYGAYGVAGISAFSDDINPK